MSALLTTLLPLILKYVVPLIAGWFAAKGHGTLSANPDATAQQFQILLGSWSAIAAASMASGSGIQWAVNRNAGAIDSARLVQIIGIVLHLVEIFAPDTIKPLIEALIKVLSPAEAKALGIAR